MKNDAIKFGLYYGAFSIILTLFTYFTDPKSLMNLSLRNIILSYAIIGGFMYFTVKKVKEKKGGFITFGEAFVPSIVMFTVGVLINSLFQFMLINYIDTGLLPILEEGSRELTEKMYDTMGMSEEAKLQALEDAEQRKSEGWGPFSFLSLMLGNIVEIIIQGFPLAAIIAAISKKKEPMPVV
jgi:hypothetical protein